MSMKSKLLACLERRKKANITTQRGMLGFSDDEKVVIQFEDCLATIKFDDVYPYWKSEKSPIARISNILSDTTVVVTGYNAGENTFTLKHSELYLQEAKEIKIGSQFDTVVTGMDKYNLFCQLPQGNIVRVNIKETGRAFISDTSKLFIVGDKAKLMVIDYHDEDGIMRYEGTMNIPQEFNAWEGKRVRVCIGSSENKVEGGIFASILGCGEERAGILDLPDGVDIREGSIIIVRIQKIAGDRIKLRLE